MSVRSVVVAHRETLAAEGIAAALSRYPALALVGVATSAAEAERCAGRADAVAIDVRIPGAMGAVGRMRTRGIRVVVIGDPSPDEEGVAVPVDAPVARLVSALVPGAAPRAPFAPGLTGRERQVLGLAAKGMAAKQIARGDDDAQMAKAAEILKETRRRLYGILAEE